MAPSKRSRRGAVQAAYASIAQAKGAAAAARSRCSSKGSKQGGATAKRFECGRKYKVPPGGGGEASRSRQCTCYPQQSGRKNEAQAQQKLTALRNKVAYMLNQSSSAESLKLNAKQDSKDDDVHDANELLEQVNQARNELNALQGLDVCLRQHIH